MKVFTEHELHLTKLLEDQLSIIRREVLGFIEDNPDLFADATDHDILETIKNCPYVAIEQRPDADHTVQHIGEQYTAPTNYLNLHEDDYYELKKFLIGLDIESRIMVRDGKTARVTIQSRNLLREALMYSRIQHQQDVTDALRRIKNESRWAL